MSITLNGSGTWRQSGAFHYPPAESAFINELRQNGFGVISFTMRSTSWFSPTYAWTLRLEGDDAARVLQLMRTYFAYYFNDLNLSVENAPYVGATVGLTQTFQNLFGGSGNGGNTYTVVRGDTFNQIAARFNLTPAQLHALNPQVTNINLISVGQVLTIRGTAQAAIPVATHINTQTGQTTVTPAPVTQTPPRVNDPNRNWFDRTFFDGAGALTGAGVGVLIVLGTVVFVKVSRG